jgi:hypothetical protein
MDKVGFFQGSEEHGPAAVPLFGPADAYFEKTASATLLPEVASFIAALKPQGDCQYVLVNAMGAGEYYSSNINGDRFSEAALIHRPDKWVGIPAVDKVTAADWAYGFPTFYRAHVYAHHRNKDANRALGFVELAAWNPHMKRVELITRLEKDRCQKFGGEGAWDKLKAGGYPDVSMGTKVPFDTCSITLDRKLYQKAWDTYDPKKDKSPGDAILKFHKELKAKNDVGIRGLSITRNDYSEYGRTQMNRILPDGRKVWVDNDFPAFFDISFVFIGADKIAKSMMKIADDGKMYSFMGSAELAEKLGYSTAQEKTASVAEPELVVGARAKQAAMTKKVVPNQLAGKAVPALAASEPSLPTDLLNSLGDAGLARSLSTLTGLGIVLRPSEFQRVSLASQGKKSLADQLEQLGESFPQTDEKTPSAISEQDFSATIAQQLLPFMAMRSALGPFIERRVVIVVASPEKKASAASSHPSELLRKIGAAYQGYRDDLMQLVPSAQHLIESATTPRDVELRKVAAAEPGDLFTPLSFSYLKHAFLNEVPLGNIEKSVVNLSSDQANAGVQRVSPFVTTR